MLSILKYGEVQKVSQRTWQVMKTYGRKGGNAPVDSRRSMEVGGHHNILYPFLSLKETISTY